MSIKKHSNTIPHIAPYYGDREIMAVNAYLKSGGYLTEYNVSQEFEKQLAAFLDVAHISLVPSGTSALYVSLLASGLTKKSLVAVPDLTMVATYNVVLAAGMCPILIDVDESGCLDLEKLPGNIDGLIYVDLNGRSGDLVKLTSYCRRNNIVLIEDACQALGSSSQKRYLGTFGRFGCFSLGFHKIITTGQGGFIVSHTKSDYEAVERLKDFGRLTGGNDIHDFFGLNFKFTDLQAAFGLEQLKTINWRMEQKRKIYEWYWKREPKAGYVPWFIDHQSANLNSDFERLNNLGIGCRKMYPPLHSQKFIKADGNFPVTEKLSGQILWLPSSLSLTREEVDHINANL